MGSSSSVPPSERPSPERVRELAEQAKMAESMHRFWIPEQGIYFGDK
mgnify:CR=1 FL=1|jgi:hypothetical protein